MKVFSVGSAPMESSVSIIPNTPQSRVPEVCDITASTSYRTNRLTVTKIVTGLFIRFAPFCSFRQKKAKMPHNRVSEAKKAKKMVAVVAAMIMVLSMGMVSVNAAEIQPRGALCPACGGTVRSTVSYSKWAQTSTTRNCTHYPNGEDRQMMRYKYTDTFCLYCGAGGRTTKTEYTWECHGYY